MEQPRIITNPRRKKQIEEFIDKNHSVASEYRTIIEGGRSFGNFSFLRRQIISLLLIGSTKSVARFSPAKTSLSTLIK